MTDVTNPVQMRMKLFAVECVDAQFCCSSLNCLSMYHVVCGFKYDNVVSGLEAL